MLVCLREHGYVLLTNALSLRCWLYKQDFFCGFLSIISPQRSSGLVPGESSLLLQCECLFLLLNPMHGVVCHLKAGGHWMMLSESQEASPVKQRWEAGKFPIACLQKSERCIFLPPLATVVCCRRNLWWAEEGSGHLLATLVIAMYCFQKCRKFSC